MTEETVQVDAPAPAPASGHGNVARVIEALYARRFAIKTLVVATIDEKNQSDAQISAPLNPSGAAHLLRMLDVRLNRAYERGMFVGAAIAPVTAGVRGNEVAEKLPQLTRAQLARQPVPRTVRRLIKKHESKIHKRQVR